MELILGFIEFTQCLQKIDSILKNEYNYNHGLSCLYKLSIQNQCLLKLSDIVTRSITFNIFQLADCIPLSAIIENCQEKVNKYGVILCTNDCDDTNSNSNKKNKNLCKCIVEINRLLSDLSLFYFICYGLYTKYIKIGCQFEINIGHSLRQDFANLFGEFDILQCLDNTCMTTSGKEVLENANEIVEIVYEKQVDIRTHVSSVRKYTTTPLSEIIDVKTNCNQLKLTINDLALLLLKETDIDVNNYNFDNIVRQLQTNVVSFLIVFGKLCESANAELRSLLTFSFKRFKSKNRS